MPDGFIMHLPDNRLSFSSKLIKKESPFRSDRRLQNAMILRSNTRYGAFLSSADYAQINDTRRGCAQSPIIYIMT